MELGGYQVDREVGRGGMGVVLRARGLDGRFYAIKVLLHAQKPEARARFAREQRLLSSFGEKEGFVPLVGTGESPRGPFLVMPFLEGGTLRDRLAHAPLPPEEVRALGVDLARAIGAAHDKGVVHRDLKPENVLFTQEGRALIADLGLAKHFDDEAAGSGHSVSLSKTGESKGTLGYMPPEQVGDSRNVGPAADVFSLGVILYECATGVGPFASDSAHAILAHAAMGEFVPLRKHRRGFPPGLAHTIESALAPLPANRPRDGGTLSRALAQPEKPARHGWKLALAGALLVAVAGAGVWRFVATRPPGGATPGAGPALNSTPAPGTSPVPARVDSRFPACCRSFRESARTRLEAVIGTFPGHLGTRFDALAWSPDGKTLLAGGFDGKLWILDAATGEALREPDSFGSGVTSIVFSRDSQLYAAGAVMGLSRVVSVATGEVVGEWKHPGGWIEAVAFSPGMDEVAGANESGTIEIHDLTGKSVLKLGPVGGQLPKGGTWFHSPDAIGYLPDGRLVTAGREKPDRTTYQLFVWSPRTSETPVARLDGHTSFVRDLAVSKDGTILSAGYDSTIKVWDVKDRTPIRSFEFGGEVIGVAFSDDGRRFAATGMHGAVVVRDAATGSEIRTLAPHEAESHAVALSPDGAKVASGGFDGVLRVRDVGTGNDLWPTVGHGQRVGSLALAGTKLVSASEDGTCRVWDPATRLEQRRLIDRQPSDLGAADPSVNVVSATPDGHSAVIGCSDGTVRFVDPLAGKKLRVFHPGQVANVLGLAITPDGKHAFGGDDRFGVKFWDDSALVEDQVPFDDEADLTHSRASGGKAFSVALSRDGKLGLSGGEHRSILWDMESSHRVLELPDPADRITAVALSPDAQTALTTSRAPEIHVWDLPVMRRGGDRDPSKILAGHKGPIDALAFFPDGDRVASASQDRTIRLWSLRLGKEIDRIDLASSFDHATSLAVTPDGKSLWAGTGRGLILRFEVTPGAK